MTVTMDATTNVTDPGLAEQTKEQRLAAGGKQGDRVRVTQVWDGQWMNEVGQEGEVLAVDAGDARLPFNVRMSSGSTLWVHAVEKVEPIDGEANVGDRVKVLVAPNVSAAVGQIATVLDGLVLGDALHLKVRLDEPVRSDLGDTQADWMITSWQRVSDAPTLDGIPEPPKEVIDRQALEEENTRLKADVERLKAENESLATIANRNRADLQAFKEQVREVAIRVADEQSWCDPGLNEVLDELGLERKEREYEVEVKVIAYAYHTVTVTATNSDEAGEKAQEEIQNEDLSSMDWTVDDTDVNEVNEA